MRRTFLALSLALSCALAGSAQAQSFSTVEERMSAADFRRAGLDKLSPEELASLNAWLQQDAARRGAVVAAPEDRRGFEDGGIFRSSQDGDRIVATVAGRFSGWRGAGDRITLSNGQVWRITDSSTDLRVDLEDPQVVLERNAFGGWQLRVEGYNTRARVVRER
jgi:hypothetical protein